MATPLTPAPYRALLETHLRRNPHAGYVQLATVEDGRPRVRTVLFQGLCILYMNQQEHLGLCIKTSRASNKVQRAESDLTEICWWMEDTMVQFRFSGPIDYSDGPDRQRVWRSLGRAAQDQFFFPTDQGLDDRPPPGGSLFAQQAARAAADQEEGLGGPPESFVVGRLFPDEVDFLDLSTCMRHRWNLQTNDDGTVQWMETKGYAPPVVSTTKGPKHGR